MNNFPEIKNMNSLPCALPSAPQPLWLRKRRSALSKSLGARFSSLRSDGTAPGHHGPLRQNQGHSVGVPMPDTDVKIVEWRQAPRRCHRETGEIIIKGPQIMKGYWNLPERRPRPFAWV